MSKIIDVVLITNFWHFKEEKLSSRYRSMADLLAKAGYKLEVITSSFQHLKKTQRDISRLQIDALPYKVTMLYEPSYKKNISLKRIYSHHKFSKNVSKYLTTRQHPDIIITSVPTLAVGEIVSKYAKKNHIKNIIDVQDLWPEAFKMAFDVPIVSDILFAPMMKQANRIYANADYILAVSETYVQRVLSVNKKCGEGTSIYIGSDPLIIKEETANISIDKPDNEFWIGYIGTLGHSYDLKSIIDAIKILKDRGITQVCFKIMGEGPLKESFQQYALKQGVICEFTGFLKYGIMMSILEKCDIAVNPINEKSVASIINKVSDYAMAGVPVINTQNSKEYCDLLEKYNCGLNCESGDANSIANAIEYLYFDENARKQMKYNSLKLAREKFDREITYQKVVDILKKMES